MTLLDVEELTAYWAEHPPLHMLVAAYLGLGKGKRPREPSAPSGEASTRFGQKTGSDITSLLAELGPGFGSGDVHAGLAPAVLDFTELRRQVTAGH
jgi:hypothetical protein